MRLNSRSLFDTRVSLRATACAAIKVSSGPMGVPACFSLARTAAYETASSEVNSSTTSGRKKCSSYQVATGQALPAGATGLSASRTRISNDPRCPTRVTAVGHRPRRQSHHNLCLLVVDPRIAQTARLTSRWCAAAGGRRKRMPGPNARRPPWRRRRDSGAIAG